MTNFHENQWRQVLGSGLERIHHALLLHGRTGLGKEVFADTLAALLLCANPQGSNPCGECEACRWRLAGTHPDLRRIDPNESEDESAGETEGGREKRGQPSIRIDQIRELDDFVYVGSHRAGRRIALILGAESMNPAAANALLKMLEEPPASVYFILVTSKPRALLPTLRSRCMSIAFQVPARVDAEAWLRTEQADPAATRLLGLASGAPLVVKRWSEEGRIGLLEQATKLCEGPPRDPIALAEAWSRLTGARGLSMEHLVDVLQRWITDQALAAAGTRPRYFPEFSIKSGSSLALPRLLACSRELARIRRSARHPLNPQLFLEDLAARFLKGTAGA